jgi:zinc protease
MRRFLGRAVAVVGFVTAAATAAHAIDIEKVTSPGGIEAWLVSDDTVPIVAMEFAFEGAGAAQDPLGKAGRANIMAALLDEGAGELDSAAFQTALQDSAVRMGFDVGRDHLFGDMRALSSSVERGIELLALALSEPRFDEGEIERISAKVIAGLRRQSQDPDQVAADLWYRTTFPDHPYGTPREGTLDSVPAIAREDLVEAHAAGLARDNLIVAVVGDIDAERLGPLLDRAFGHLPETADLKDVPEITPATGLTVTETLQTPQTAIRFGGPGLKRDDEDFIPAVVMNHILGGGAFSSWLFQEVREKRGLAYSVYSFVAPFENSAIFGGGTATRNDQAEEALAVIRAQLERMGGEGPSQDELAEAKDYLTGSYALRFGSSNSIARQLLGIQLADLGMEYVDIRNDLIEAVTLEDVRRVARRILGAGEPTVAVVGAPAG